MAYTTSKAFGRYVKQDIAKQPHSILSFTQYHIHVHVSSKNLLEMIYSTVLRTVSSYLVDTKLYSIIGWILNSYFQSGNYYLLHKYYPLHRKEMSLNFFDVHG